MKNLSQNIKNIFSFATLKKTALYDIHVSLGAKIV
jgi:hypothetical protein